MDSWASQVTAAGTPCGTMHVFPQVTRTILVNLRHCLLQKTNYNVCMQSGPSFSRPTVWTAEDITQILNNYFVRRLSQLNERKVMISHECIIIIWQNQIHHRQPISLITVDSLSSGPSFAPMNKLAAIK